MRCDAPGCSEEATVRLPERAICRAHAVGIADRLARRVVVERDGGRCRRCGREDDGVQWAHILGRRVAPALRYDPANALSLCWSCHGYFTAHPARFSEWLEEELPGRRADLVLRQAEAERSGVSRPLDATIAWLRAELLTEESA